MPLYYCDFQLPVLAYIFGATIWVDKSKRLGEREREAAIFRKRGLAAWEHRYRDTVVRSPSGQH
jgi:hypothetical protein